MYCQTGDLILPPGVAVNVQDTQLTSSIADAEGEVNAALADSGYNVPFPDDDVPPLIQQITIGIATYLAYLEGQQGQPVAAGDPIQARYTRAKTLLEDVRTGKKSLGQPSQPDDPATDVTDKGSGIVNQYPGALFGPDDVGIQYTTGGMWQSDRRPRGINRPGT